MVRSTGAGSRRSTASRTASSRLRKPRRSTPSVGSKWRTAWCSPAVALNGRSCSARTDERREMLDRREAGGQATAAHLERGALGHVGDVLPGGALDEQRRARWQAAVGQLGEGVRAQFDRVPGRSSNGGMSGVSTISPIRRGGASSRRDPSRRLAGQRKRWRAPGGPLLVALVAGQRLRHVQGGRREQARVVDQREVEVHAAQVQA